MQRDDHGKVEMGLGGRALMCQSLKSWGCNGAILRYSPASKTA